MFKSDSKKGYALIELLIVLAIIGILGGIAVPLYLGQQRKAAFSEAKANLEAIRLLEEQYRSEFARYAPDPDGTIPYKGTVAADGGIEDVLRGFQPGPAADLKFNYTLQSLNNGTGFIAIATGKPDTNVADSVFSINERNEKSW